MNSKQKELLKEYFQNNVIDEFIHGDALGSDKEAHELLFSLKPEVHIKIFPTLKNRAFCSVLNGKIFEESSDPLKRNQKIVDSCDLLLVCPKNEKEEIRSGTWSTYRYAKEKGKKIKILI